MDVISLLALIIQDLFRSRVALEAEIVLLRHQVAILKRIAKLVPLTPRDRLIFVAVYRLCVQAFQALHIVKPDMVVRWHRQGCRAYRRWKSKGRPRRPRVCEELRSLIREISRANPLWGAQRIHGELLKLGFSVAQSTVSKYMISRPGMPGPTWKSFVHNHIHVIAGVDFFLVPTIRFQLLYGSAILRLDRRRLVHFAVTGHPTAEWTAQQIREAFPWDEAPTLLIWDRDAIYGAAHKRHLEAKGIRDGPNAPRSPCQNGMVERWIGSVRRESLDHVIIFDEGRFRRILKAYADYIQIRPVRTSLWASMRAIQGRSLA